MVVDLELVSCGLLKVIGSFNHQELVAAQQTFWAVFVDKEGGMVFRSDDDTAHKARWTTAESCETIYIL